MKRLLVPLLFGTAALAAGSAMADSITFFQDENFAGRQFAADRPVTNFDRNGFNDRARSVVVHDGRWEISLQRLPRMPNGHAIVQVSAEGELLDFEISDA